ncbi:hypothetical protein QE394_001638 [Arthrobacter sp. SORGH_AS 212]|nr:hypothetical protein [Arthrobacter sp. SORGH_AS_0212]
MQPGGFPAGLAVQDLAASTESYRKLGNPVCLDQHV